MTNLSCGGERESARGRAAEPAWVGVGAFPCSRQWVHRQLQPFMLHCVVCCTCDYCCWDGNLVVNHPLLLLLLPGMCCRFQDGKICEAVVWEGVPTGQRHFIPDQAVAYMLTRHLPAGTVITSCATALDPLLYASSSDDTDAAADNVLWSSSSRSIPPGAAAAAGTAAAPAAADSRSSASVSIGGDGTGSSSSAAAEETAASRAADAALDSLTKQLRALSDLALKVIGVQPLSTVTRHTCCFYPEPHPLAEGSGARAYTPGTKVPRVLEPIDVMVQLEGTGEGCLFS